MSTENNRRAESEPLLHYRPWKGEMSSPSSSTFPIARLSLLMVFRRKLFWGLYALALFIFFMFFFGQYMLFWAESQAGQEAVRLMGRRTTPGGLIKVFRERLKLNGSGETYRNFYWYQGYMVMVLLALGGSILVGNDFRHRSLPFYLSKPISPHHYLLGKSLAIAVLINLMTTLPALALFIQYGLLATEDYFSQSWLLLLGILGYGAVLTIVLTALLMATSVRLQKTVPLIMAWTTLFFFCRRLARSLVVRLDLDPNWRLMDLWNDMYIVGNALLGLRMPSPQHHPPLLHAALILLAVVLGCVLYLMRRVRGVEIVT